MAKIAIDCDGVLANFIKAFAEEANHIWPGKIPNPSEYAAREHKTWDWPPEVLSKAEVKEVWKRINGSVNWWLTLDAFTAGVGALAIWLWTHKWHDVYVCTARQETLGGSVAWQTDQWLRACGIDPVHNYLGVVTIDGQEKGQFYRLAGITHSLDDRGLTVELCDQLMPDREHRAYLLDRPWNQDAKVRHRVGSVREYLEVVER